MNRGYTIKVAMGKEMQVCPLCKGKGTLPTGFYGNPGCSQGDVMQNKFPATCRVCFGKGVIETGKEQNGEPLTMEIKDLMNRAKAAEKQRDEARQDCAVAERNHMIEVECRKAEEARAEKAKEIAIELCDDFTDFVTGGVHNAAPYCANFRPECVNNRGWCNGDNKVCRGFFPKAARIKKEE